MYTERLVGSVVSRVRHVVTSSCVVRGDSSVEVSHIRRSDTCLRQSVF